MNEFYAQILNENTGPQLSQLEKYIENVNKLYFPRRDFRDPRIAQHIELLLHKYDHIDFALESAEYVEKFNELKLDHSWSNTETEEFMNWKDLDITVPKLSKKDLNIARILKEDCRGLSITISPPLSTCNDIDSWPNLLYNFSKISCPHVKSGFYFIEFNTDSKQRPHIHFYCNLHSYTKETVNRTRAYYTAIFKKKAFKANVACFRKPDISYGRDYLTAIDSSPKKQLLKERDRIFREKNSIPSYFQYDSSTEPINFIGGPPES